MIGDRLELPRDADGRVVGFLVGKAQRMADWYARKEAAKYETLFNRLRVLKWQRQVREEDGPRLEKLKARGREYAARPEVKLRAKELARIRRRARYYLAPRVTTCLECGATWSLLFGVRGPLPRFCDEACRQRFRYQERTPGARRIKRSSRRRSLRL